MLAAAGLKRALCTLRALQERVRLRRKRQAKLLRLQSRLQVFVQSPKEAPAAGTIRALLVLYTACFVQVSAAGFHQAKSALAEARVKVAKHVEELQELKRLRYMQCVSRQLGAWGSV